MHKVTESGTYQSKDKTKSVQLTEGEVIDDRDAEDLGLASAADRDDAERQAREEETAKRLNEGRSKGRAPENR